MGLLSKIFSGVDVDLLQEENRLLRESQYLQVEYIRKKTNQLLLLMGTLPLRSEELDDESLIQQDPIGVVAETFAQIMEHEKVLNERLKLAHDQMQAIVSAAGVGIMLIDNAMRIQLCNDRVQVMFGSGTEDLQGRLCCQAVCGSSIPPVNCTYEKVLETKRPVHQPDWEYKGRHFDVTGSPIRNRFGDITHIILVYTDITHRVDRERRLKERERLYKQLFENSGEIIQCVSSEGKFVFVNSQWRKTLGYSEEDLQSLSFWNIVSPDMRKESMEAFGRVLHGKPNESVRTNMFTKDGRDVPVKGSISSSYELQDRQMVLGIFHAVAEDGE